ncbi:DUF2164 domain-containing protein [Oleiagrimonas soli]|uniref:Uncharacterized protein (DUF2164 family) n=1 Tax=Oleiagrimonas soli TaxID=1543381 RepID=A0A099CYJ6_9GAMM|nr:DUF2164 domain-containing protein [Oleiagrimonas soli]KGI78834.1 hypothetical protein LF63_0102540 [Oleiagrimonas soli]MBB6184377.1 uncharacterized protein (DUF2164 family) [Oleiagrimonas soli]
MSAIAFTREEKDRMVGRIKQYFAEQLDQEIGQFDAEFLLDFFAEDLGAYFYNRGLYDAQAALSARIDDVQDAIGQLERPTEYRT